MTPLDRRIGASVERRDCVDSTMDACAAAARDGAPNGHVVVAARQTAGRGRTGAAWHSDDPGGLYLSVLLRDFDSPAAAAGVTIASGIALHDAAGALGVAAADLKWPNDLLKDGRKLAGTIAEWREPGGVLIVGVGFNVSQQGFPPDLADTATSIALATGKTVPADEALAALLGALDHAVEAFRYGGLAWAVPEWSKRSTLWGRHGRAAGVAGILVRLDPDGALVLRDDDGSERRVVAHPVSVD